MAVTAGKLLVHAIAQEVCHWLFLMGSDGDINACLCENPYHVGWRLSPLISR